jgi:hypothetical protein
MVQNGAMVQLEAAVWVRTANGWRRAFGWWPASNDGPAVWEVSVRETDLGLHELAWLTDDEVGAVIVTDAAWRPSRRDQVDATFEQSRVDLERARARLRAKAPVGWSSRPA